MSELKHLSVSQVEKYAECPRKHFYEYILGERSPSTKAQEYGKACHEIIEQYLRGEITSEDIAKIRFHGKTILAGIDALPKHDDPHIEDYFEINNERLNAPIIGYIDYYHVEGETAVLIDHKIVKNDRYLLDEAKLKRKFQIIVYAKHLFDTTGVSRVEASYYYYQRGGGFFKKVTVVLTPVETEARFKEFLSLAVATQKNYFASSVDNTVQQLASCEKWGGCHFKPRCWGEQNQMSTSNPLLDRLKGLATQSAISAMKSVAPVEVTEITENKADSLKQVLDNKIENANKNESTSTDDIFDDIASQEDGIQNVLLTDKNNEEHKISLDNLNEDDYLNLHIEENDAEVYTDEIQDEDIVTNIEIEPYNGDTDLLTQPIETIEGLKNRTKNALKKNGFSTLLQFKDHYGFNFTGLDTEAECFEQVKITMSTLDGFGLGSVNDLSKFIFDNNLFNFEDPSLNDFCPQDYETEEDTDTEATVSTETTETTETTEATETTEPTETTETTETTEATETTEPTETTEATEPTEPTEATKTTEPTETTETTEATEATEATENTTEDSQDDNSSESDNMSVQAPQQQTPRKILFIGCMPMKGLKFQTFEDLIAPIELGIAQSNEVPHISMMNFAKGYDQVAAFVANTNWLGNDPIMVTNTTYNTYSKAVTALIQKADIVIKG